MAEVDYEDIELHERLHAARAVVARQKAEIERLRADIDLHERLRAACAVIAQQKAEIERLRADLARLGSFLYPIGEEARRG